MSKRRLLVACLALFALIVAQPVASAETLQAPYGGQPIALGLGRVACAPAPPGWSLVGNGSAVRPPDTETAIGTVGELKTAPTALACATSTDTIHLGVVGRRPTLDAPSVSFFPDEGRVEARGHHLKNAGVAWRSTAASGSSVCKPLKADQGFEQCSWSVGRGLLAAPGSITMTLVPDGAHVGDDVVTFDIDGKRVDAETQLVAPSRVILAPLVPADASVDLSTGRGRVALSHPEVISSVDCGPARCELAAGALLVRGLSSDANAVDVRVKLAPQVFVRTGAGLEAQPTLHLAVLHCPMSVASGPPLRATSSARLVVHIEGGCGKHPSMLKFEVDGDTLDVLETVAEAGAADVLLALGSADASALVVNAVLAQDPSVVVATARVDTRAPPQLHASVGIPGHPNLDFIPNNRPAVVHTRAPEGQGHWVVLPIDGVYANVEPKEQTILGDERAAGTTALRFGLRVDSLPGQLRNADLAVLTDPVQRGIHPANTPAPLGEFAPPGKGLVELVCGPAGATTRVAPGAAFHLPYGTRDDCRVVFHRERLSAKFGSQKLKLGIEVLSSDGSARGDGHVAETLVLQPGNRPLYAWIHGVGAPFDRVVVRVSHDADEGHYLDATELTNGTPEVKWSIIFGTGNLRLYATSAIPTGLYRFGDKDHSGALSLNLGIVSRLTWLDSEGHEGFIGLEGGLMAFGLTNDKSTTGQSLTQVGVVTGLGIGVPIANRSSATEASISLHGWLERDLSHVSGSGLSFVFGPSISIGNVGANL